MSKILEKIEEKVKYFPKQGRYGQFVEIFDNETKECIYMPCNCAFNCMVLALKETGHITSVSIIHRRDSLIRANGTEEVYYAEYALLDDGKVHNIKRHGGLYIYAERESA